MSSANLTVLGHGNPVVVPPAKAWAGAPRRGSMPADASSPLIRCRLRIGGRRNDSSVAAFATGGRSCDPRLGPGRLHQWLPAVGADLRPVHLLVLLAGRHARVVSRQDGHPALGGHERSPFD